MDVTNWNCSGRDGIVKHDASGEKIHLSPGAVSLQLHNLPWNEHRMFVRSGKRLVPTPAATRLAEHAKAVANR